MEGENIFLPSRMAVPGGVSSVLSVLSVRFEGGVYFFHAKDLGEGMIVEEIKGHAASGTP